MRDLSSILFTLYTLYIYIYIYVYTLIGLWFASHQFLFDSFLLFPIVDAASIQVLHFCYIATVRVELPSVCQGRKHNTKEGAGAARELPSTLLKSTRANCFLGAVLSIPICARGREKIWSWVTFRFVSPFYRWSILLYSSSSVHCREHASRLISARTTCYESARCTLRAWEFAIWHNINTMQEREEEKQKWNSPLDAILSSIRVATGAMNLLTVWNSRRTDRTSSQASPFPHRFGALCSLWRNHQFMPEHEEDEGTILFLLPADLLCPISGAHGGNDWKHDRSRPSGGWHHLVHTHTHTGPLQLAEPAGHSIAVLQIKECKLQQALLGTQTQHIHTHTRRLISCAAAPRNQLSGDGKQQRKK